MKKKKLKNSKFDKIQILTEVKNSTNDKTLKIKM